MTAGQPVDPFLPIEEALQRLVDDLDELDDLESSAAELDSHPDYFDQLVDERSRVMATLGRVAIFMQSLPELAGKERERPLVTLLSALTDVHQGRTSDLLTPVRGPGKRMPPIEEQYARARAAAAMEFLTKIDGCSNKEAAQRVARRLLNNGKGYLFTDESEPYTQVKRWWIQVNKRPVGTDPARHYKILVDWGHTAGLGPEQTAKKLLEFI